MNRHPDECLAGLMTQLAARLGPEPMGRLLPAVAEMATRHGCLDCETVNRELAASGHDDLQVDQPTLKLALDALRRAGFLRVEPVQVH